MGSEVKRQNMERTLLRMLRCMKCGGSLQDGEPEQPDHAICLECGTPYLCVSGIWCMLHLRHHEVHERFLSTYAALRQQEGWVRNKSYYLMLPDVPADDPAAGIWRIRRRSLAALDRLVAEGASNSAGGEWALDLGAGCGWLSRHLTMRGYNTVATDLNIEGNDSLQGVQLYIEHDQTWIGRVQASMDDLPFADGSFALCVVSGALHYALLAQTLEQVWRVLQPGGLFFITDSPVYKDAQAGQSMAAEQRSRAEALLGKPLAPLPGGEGYFVKDQLVDALLTAGFRVRLLYTESKLGRLRAMLRRKLAPGRGEAHREHARFPVIMAAKS